MLVFADSMVLTTSAVAPPFGGKCNLDSRSAPAVKDLSATGSYCLADFPIDWPGAVIE
jgi:hypothetical protein